MCFVGISEQTAVNYLKILTGWFLKETNSVYCVVRTNYLNKLRIKSLRIVAFFRCGLNKPEKDLCCPNSAFLRRRWATSFARELRGDEWDVFPPPRSWRGSSSRYHTGLSSRKAFCRSTVHSPRSHTSCSIQKRNKL